MGRELRFAAALRGEEAEGYHLALGQRQARAGVVVAEAVGGEPAVDVTGLPGLQHLRTENVGLGLGALFQPVGHGGRGLPGKRQGDAARREHLVGPVQEGEHTAHAEVVHCLVDNLLDHDGSEPVVQGAAQLIGELVEALAAEQRGQYRHVARLAVELLPRFVDHFVKGKVLVALGKFGVCFTVIHIYLLLIFSGSRLTTRAAQRKRRGCSEP